MNGNPRLSEAAQRMREALRTVAPERASDSAGEVPSPRAVPARHAFGPREAAPQSAGLERRLERLETMLARLVEGVEAAAARADVAEPAPSPRRRRRGSLRLAGPALLAALSFALGVLAAGPLGAWIDRDGPAQAWRALAAGATDLVDRFEGRAGTVEQPAEGPAAAPPPALTPPPAPTPP